MVNGDCILLKSLLVFNKRDFLHVLSIDSGVSWGWSKQPKNILSIPSNRSRSANEKIQLKNTYEL